MLHGNTAFHRVSEIHFEKNSSNGTLWIDITIKDCEGDLHEVTCCAYDGELPKITIDDKLVAK